MDPISAGIGAVAGLFGQGISNAASKRAATTAFKRQKELFDYQAAYNTPANQMKRLKLAGLNPALMYGKGTVGNVDSFAGVQQAKIQGIDLAQSAAHGAQLPLAAAQAEESKARGALASAEAKIKSLYGDALTQNKAAYIDSLLNEWSITKSEASLREIANEMQKNGIYNSVFASAMSLISGKPGHTVNVNEKVLAGSKIAEMLGIDGITYGQAILTAIGLVKAGAWGVEKLLQFRLMLGKSNSNKGKTNTPLKNNTSRGWYEKGPDGKWIYKN
ncbi:MAG: hypothetical protein EBY39_10110 [Flavobacteriia bacterium]|nr:hypothetical protein [Flavobacteriia bacterium]